MGDDFNWANATDAEIRNSLIYGNIEGTGSGNYGHYGQKDIDNARQFNQYSPEVQAKFNPWDDTKEQFFAANPLDQGRYVGNPNHGFELSINPGTGGMSKFASPDIGMMGGGMSGAETSRGPMIPGQGNLDMSGFKPPRFATMDVVSYTLNGEEHTGSSSYLGSLKEYLNSTGQGDALTTNGSALTQQPHTGFGLDSSIKKHAMSPWTEPRTYQGPDVQQDDMASNTLSQPDDTSATAWGSTPTQPAPDFSDIPMWQGFPQQSNTPAPTQQPTYGDAGMANLGYTAQQLAGTQPAGLEKQNLDYALSQLGMMTGGAGSAGTVGSGGVSNPGFNAPYGGATPGGGYTNPFTGTDSAGRTQDDPYYGGDSDYGTAGGEGFGYSTSNAWTNYGRDVAGFLPGSMFTQPIGDAMMGLSPVPFAGNYVPGTDTYIPEYLTNYVGPGDVTTDVWGLGTGEQRDMMIEQGRLGGGMLGGSSADPDQQFFENQQEALDWYNNGVSVANPYDPGTAEAVAVANEYADLFGSSFGTEAEAQIIANHGFGSDEHMEILEKQQDSFLKSLEGVPEEEFIRQAKQFQMKTQAADLQAKADAKEAEDKANAATRKEELDTQYNKYVGFTSEQLGLLSTGLTAQIGGLTTQLEESQDLNAEERTKLKDSLYTMTADKVDTINAQLDGISNVNSESYTNLLEQLETVEGSLIEQINESYVGSYNTTKEWIDKLTGKVDALGGIQKTQENTYNKQLANLGVLMTEQKTWTEKQLGDFKTTTADNITKIESELLNNKNLSEKARNTLKDQLHTYTDSQVTTINSELLNIKDVNSQQYNDLLNQLETVEGDLTQQIEDAYTGPNTGYNPITDDAPDTGGTQPEDIGGTSTTVDDAYDEISSGYDDPSDSSGSSGGDSGGGGCFITTATLQEVDTKDDGKELTTFRDFRDNYLSKKSYGGALVRDYYDTAPKVVEVINNRENHKQLYQSIWKEHLNPINKLIEKGDNAEATSKYMLMMEELKEKFLPRKGEGL